MYDLHSHIMPGVDDGAVDIEESVSMAKIARDNGIKNIMATPHYLEGVWCKNYAYNQKILNELKKELVRKKIDIEVFLGNEVFITSDILKLLSQGEITTLNKSRYILIELPTIDIPIFTENLIYELRLNKFIPIIAHPERNIKIIEDPNILYGFIMKGALAQLNLPSIAGRYGDGIKNTARILLKNNMIHFIGTDAHAYKSVLSRLKSDIGVLVKSMNRSKLDKILYKNPEAVINDQMIETEEPRKYSPKNKFKNFFK
ncbi:hypothetical protein QBE52_10300 [Clostridiaceae bacterium 35-E11]